MLKAMTTRTFASRVASVGTVKSADQHAKKVKSDSPGLVDFAIGLVNSVFNLPNGQVIVFEQLE